MNTSVENSYRDWCSRSLEDSALTEELQDISGKDDEINDRFYRDLQFGTGGLRGVLGAGTNRMNIYTVAKATRGYAKYLLSKNEKPSVAIAYDSRINSTLFAQTAASVMASCGVQVWIWPELMPTPSLSFAVRYLHTSGGIVITASHNPAKYNGYKVYGPDGCQITTEAAAEIFASIRTVDIFKDYSPVKYEDGVKAENIRIIPEECFTSFIDAVSAQSLCGDGINKNVKIVYTPLYGTGLKCVTTCLKQNGFTDIETVKEQSHPDGNFPTCPYPNPEIREALEVGLKTAAEKNADLLIATDPDCDRVGIAVRKGNDFQLLTGNEVGLLLLDYVCKRRMALHKMPQDPVCVKTIVTSDLACKIAENYGVQVIDVLTGFKFIGEQIGHLEAKGEEGRYIFGFEESYGYLTGSYVRDKDAVDGSLMIAEMFAFYRAEGKSLPDVLDGLYEKYGYCLNTLHSFEFDGESGFEKMQSIMKAFRTDVPEGFAGKKVLAVSDYETQVTREAGGKEEPIRGLPKSDVLKYRLEDGISVVVRPSGTEPKLKIYISTSAENRNAAETLEKKITEEVGERLK